MIQLRPYQEKAVIQIDDEFRKRNKRVLYVSSPGTGKTEVACYMINRAIKYNFPVIFVVRGRLLVQNASDRMRKNGIDHSVFMANHWNFNPKKIIQVCSVDTMFSREKYPFQDSKCLIMLDEAHKDYKKIFEAYKEAFIVGMTGTPYTDMSDYNTYVQPIMPYEARDMGVLVPDRIYCPNLIDTSAVKMVAGDFDKKQLESVVTQSAVVGNIISDWKEYGENRPTVCFATSVEHSLQLKQAFCEAGIPAVHCDANSSDELREKARKDLESGKIKILCNVDIFSTGWDCPIVSCIILARPTWSLCWYLQAVGRGVRAYPGKQNCIVLDNAGNVFRHGTHFKVREISLEKPQKRKPKQYDTKITNCEKCFLIYDPTKHDSCPECGYQKEQKARNINHIDGKLVEYEESPLQVQERRKHMIKDEYRKLEWARQKNKLRNDWTFIQLFKKYSREEMLYLEGYTKVPERFLPLPLDLQE